MSQRDYYEVLEVKREAGPKEIKEAYRKLALQYHPDRNLGDASALEKMKEINEAYAVLSDSRKRQEYDSLKQAYGSGAYDRFRQTYSDQDIFRGSDINRIFEEMARSFGVRGFEEIFRESYGQGYRTFEFRRPGVFARGYVFMGPGFRKARGGEDQAGIPPAAAPPPGLVGRAVVSLFGRILGMVLPQKGADREAAIVLDPEKAREGGKFRFLHRKQGRELLVTIPPGVREGQKIRLKGLGAEGKGGGEAGDLYLRVTLRKPLLDRMKTLLGIK
jgi:curved DNA-binding protein CbpA